MSSASADWVGRCLSHDRYRVLRPLGSGGMAEVYVARDGNLEADVVIKVPRPVLLAEPGFAERFRREVRSLIQLAHPHIVGILDLGVEQEIPFAVMPYLPGGSLEDRARALATMRTWLPQVCSALDFIHRRGFVHRDIKPGNMLLDARGNAYVSDFGIVKTLAAGEQETRRDATLTRTGMVVGTPNYMAPELIMGEAYDGRADQYALAVMLYEFLAGQRPFENSSPAAVLVQQTTAPPPDLVALNPLVPPVLAQAVTRALAKSPANRFASCADLCSAVLKSDLEAIRVPPPRISAGGPPSPPSPGACERAARASPDPFRVQIQPARSRSHKGRRPHHARTHSPDARSPEESGAPASTPKARPLLPVVVASALVVVLAAVGAWGWFAARNDSSFGAASAGRSDGGGKLPVGPGAIDGPPAENPLQIEIVDFEKIEIDEGQPWPERFQTLRLTGNTAGRRVKFHAVGDNCPPGLTVTEHGVISWTPGESDGPGEYEVQVRAELDGRPDVNDESTLVVRVNEVDQPPVIQPIRDVTLKSGESSQVTLRAFDPDVPSTSVQFFQENGPAWVTVDRDSGVVQVQPGGEVQTGEYQVTVRAVDGAGQGIGRTAAFAVSITQGMVARKPAVPLVDLQGLLLGLIDRGYHDYAAEFLQTIKADPGILADSQRSKKPCDLALVEKRLLQPRGLRVSSEKLAILDLSSSSSTSENLLGILGDSSWVKLGRVSYAFEPGLNCSPIAGLSNDGRYLAAWGPGNGISVFDTGTGQPTMVARHAISAATTSSNSISGFGFSPDGKELWFTDVIWKNVYPRVLPRGSVLPGFTTAQLDSRANPIWLDSTDASALLENLAAVSGLQDARASPWWRRRPGQSEAFAIGNQGRLLAVARNVSVSVCDRWSEGIVDLELPPLSPGKRWLQVVRPEFSLSGRLFAAVADQATSDFPPVVPVACVWDWEARKRVVTVENAFAVGFRGEAPLLARCEGLGIRISLDGQESAARLVGHRGNVVRGFFSPDGKTLYSESDMNEIIAWDLKSGRPLFPVPQHPSGIRLLAFSPDGSQLASGGDRGELILWNLATGEDVFLERHDVEPSEHEDGSLVFAPSGQHLLRQTRTGLVAWNVATGKIEAAHSPKTPLLAAQWSEGAFAVNFLDQDGTLWTWNGKSIDEIGAIPSEVKVNRRLGAAFHSAGDRVAVLANVITVLSTSGNGSVANHPVQDAKRGVSKIAMSPDFWKCVAMGEETALWALRDGQPPTLIKRAPLQARQACFGPDGGHVAISTARGVELWDATTGTSVRTFAAPVLLGETEHGPAFPVAFDPRGRYLAIGNLGHKPFILIYATPSVGQVPSEGPAVGNRKTADSSSELSFIEAPLRDACAALAKHHRVKIELDERALRNVGIETDLPITMSLKASQSVEQHLDQLLQDLSLRWEKRGGVYRIVP